MKRLAINISIAVVIIVPVLYLLQYAIDKGLKRSKTQLYITWTEIYSGKVNADVLINGSSRAAVMASPRIIDSALHINSYNMGLVGWGWEMQEARLKIYLEHNKKPKYIVQALDLTLFDHRLDLFDYEQFIPYLDDSIVVNSTRGYKGSFTFAERHFPFFKYNNRSVIIREGIKSLFGRGAPSGKYKGFYTRKVEWNTPEFDAFKKTHPEGVIQKVDTVQLLSFKRFIKYCQQNNIKLIFEFPPVDHEAFTFERNRQEIVSLLKGIAIDNQIPYLDYANDTMCYNRSYFYNSVHLNDRGAKVFSVKLANDLKPYIKL